LDVWPGDNRTGDILRVLYEELIREQSVVVNMVRGKGSAAATKSGKDVGSLTSEKGNPGKKEGLLQHKFWNVPRRTISKGGTTGQGVATTDRFLVHVLNLDRRRNAPSVLQRGRQCKRGKSWVLNGNEEEVRTGRSVRSICT